MQLPRLNVSDTAYPFRNVIFRLYLEVVKSKQTAFFSLRSMKAFMLFTTLCQPGVLPVCDNFAVFFPGILLN